MSSSIPYGTARPVYHPIDPSLASKLESKTFLTKCPPEITPKTRILCVCGVPDLDDKASPKNDGFFHSDLYLFWQMFREAEVASKLFFTCCYPSDLVKKYKRYTHGSPFCDRRVVLDQSHLQHISRENGWHVSKPAELLDIFERYLKEEADVARSKGQDLLICIFGHGAEVSKSVSIGTKSNNSYNAENLPQLTMNRVGDLVGNNVNCAIFSTACYSGGWAYNRNLNYTVMASAGKDDESYAWMVTNTITNPGSVVSNSLLEALFRVEEIQVANDAAPWDQVETTDTYAQLGEMITQELNKQDKTADRHQISFSVEDDAWEKAWRGESVANMPVGHYKKVWESLQSVPAQPDDPNNVNPHGRQDWGFNTPASTINKPLPKTGSLPPPPTDDAWYDEEVSLAQLHSKVKYMASVYMNSFPGDSGMATNTGINNFCKAVLLGDQRKEVITLREWLILFTHLRYRIQLMQRATMYARLKDLKLPDCMEFDVYKWEHDLRVAVSNNDDNAKTRSGQYHAIREMIAEAEIFPGPTGILKDFPGPRRYLAIALLELGSKPAVEAAIKQFAEIRQAEIMKEAQIFARSQPESIRARFNDKSRSLGRRLRGRSINGSSR